MEYDALAAPVHQRPCRGLLLWAGCGALLTAGLWWAASAASAPIDAHIRVKPNVDLQVGMLASQPRLSRSVPINPISQSTALQAAPAAAAAAAAPVGLGFAAGPWLSLAALIISVGAIILNFLRRSEPAPAPVPAYNWAPTEETAIVPTRKSSNRMDEVAQAIKAEQASRKNLTPKQVVLELQRGNARFWSGTPERPELNAMERRALIIAQAPTVCILSCSDSRVPVEILFDQGLGSIFVVRVAGNILDSTATGSIEFSVKYLGVKVLLVMGHEGCGAVKGAISMSNADLDAQPAYLQSVLRSIKTNLNLGSLSKIRDSRAQDREAIISNVSTQVKKLQQNQLISERVADGSLLVCGAFYEITSGIVDFFSLDKNGLVVDV